VPLTLELAERSPERPRSGPLTAADHTTASTGLAEVPAAGVGTDRLEQNHLSAARRHQELSLTWDWDCRSGPPLRISRCRAAQQALGGGWETSPTLAGDRSSPHPANDLAIRDRCRYRVISVAPSRSAARSLSTETNHSASAAGVIAMRGKGSHAADGPRSLYLIRPLATHDCKGATWRSR